MFILLVLASITEMFERIIEAFFFMGIVLGVTLGGCLVAIILRLTIGERVTLLLAGGLAGIGFIIGIVWAIRIRRKQPISSFIARIMATPELDDKEELPQPDREKK